MIRVSLVTNTYTQNRRRREGASHAILFSEHGVDQGNEVEPIEREK